MARTKLPLLITFFLLLCFEKITAQTAPEYFFLVDAKHGKALIAGDNYDNNVYHQPHNNRLNAQWRMEAACDGYFYIYDRKHNKALVAGDNYDGKVYHQVPNGRLNAQWKLVAAANGNYYLEDRKHQKALVGGDNFDGKVYRQAANSRLNAQWKKIPIAMSISSSVQFPRTNEYYDLMSNALKIPSNFSGNQEAILTPTGEMVLTSSTNFLRSTIGQLGLDAAEVILFNVPNLTPQQAIDRINTQDSTRLKVLGVIGTLLQDKLVKNQTSTEVRAWATQIFRSMKIKAAKGSLDEYKKWKADPCAYTGEGYTKPQGCYAQNPTITMFQMVTPPSDLIGKKGMQSATSSSNDIVQSVTTALAGVSFAAAAPVIGTGLGITFVSVAGTTASVTASALTCLYSAFGGTVVSAQTGAITSASIGATSWGGVVAAPLATAVFAITIGVTQGLEVYEASLVEPNLKKQLGAAMLEPINIANVLSDENGASLFFVGFIHAATKNAWNPPTVGMDGEVTFRCEAGFVSKFTLTYTLNGQNLTKNTANLSLNQEESIVIPKAATNIVAKGYMISAGEHLVFTQNIAKPTYTCFKTYNTIMNPSWANAWPLKPANTVKIFHQGGFVAKYQLDYKLNGQPQKVETGEKTAGWNETYPIPENATEVKVQGWGATGLAWEPWRQTFTVNYPEPPNVCIKTYGTTLNQQWATDCN